MWYGPLSLTSNLGKLTVKVAVMLFYDMFLTFGDEVEKIWTQPFSLAQVLWFVVRMLPNINYLTSHDLRRSKQNRYATPLGYIVVTISEYNSDLHPRE